MYVCVCVCALCPAMYSVILSVLHGVMPSVPGIRPRPGCNSDQDKAVPKELYIPAWNICSLISQSTLFSFVNQY